MGDEISGTTGRDRLGCFLDLRSLAGRVPGTARRRSLGPPDGVVLPPLPIRLEDFDSLHRRGELFPQARVAIALRFPRLGVGQQRIYIRLSHSSAKPPDQFAQRLRSLWVCHDHLRDSAWATMPGEGPEWR